MASDLSPEHVIGNGGAGRVRAPLWLKRGWPHLVWAGVCIVTFLLWSHGARFGGMKGVVVTVTEPVSTLETARVIDILVEPGQMVKAGDVVARLDPSLIEAQMAFDEAIMIEAETTITGYQQNILQLARQLDAAIQDAEAALSLEQLRQKQDEAELEELNKELLRLESLRERQLIDETPLSNLRPRMAALQIATESRPEIIRLLERRLEASRVQRAEADDWLQTGEAGDIREAIARKKEARNAIYLANQTQQALRKSLYTLHATRDGVVSQVFAEPGNVVQAGDVLIRIVLSASSQVEGFLPENYLSDVQVGQAFHIVRAAGKSPRFPANVISISPDIMVLPGRISPINAQPLHGRRILLNLEGNTDLIPGERVNIQRIPGRPGPT